MRLSALGDVCLVLPTVRTLQKHFPEAQITWVISPPQDEFLRGLEGVEFVVVDKRRPLSAYWKFFRAMRRRQFDVLLAMQASWRAHWLFPMIRAPVKIGFDPPRARDGHRVFINRRIPPGRQHLADAFLSFAAALGATPPVLDWRLPLTAADAELATEKLGPPATGFWLAVNPSASKPERNWLPERYAAVMDHVMVEWGWRVVLTGGAKAEERAFAGAVCQQVRQRERVVNLVGQTTPRQLAGVLARVQGLLSPDTGPAHIATAVGTPVVGLYAVAPSQLSGPYLSRELIVDKFPEAVRQFLGLDPARASWGTRVHCPEAMALITVAEVLERLARLRPALP